MLRMICALCLLPLPLLADAPEEPIDCINASLMIEMNICTLQEYQAADADLSTAYAKAIAAMQAYDAKYPVREGDTEEARLRAAQRVWVTFRGMNCNVEGRRMRGRDAEHLLTNGCLRTMTEARTAELLAQAEDF